MRNWTKAAGVIFLATSSIYADQAATVKAVNQASEKAATPSPLFDNSTTKPAYSAAPAASAADAPTSQPAEGSAAAVASDGAPADAAAQEGHSVTASEVNVSDAG